MSEMVDRVAKVIEAELVGHVDPYSDGLSEYGIAQKIVRATIAAMREPTEGMIQAGAESGPWSGEYSNDEKGCAVQVWQDMIAAALAEEEQL